MKGFFHHIIDVKDTYFNPMETYQYKNPMWVYAATKMNECRKGNVYQASYQ